MLTATINLYKNAYTGVNRRMWLLAVVMLINRSGTMVLCAEAIPESPVGYGPTLVRRYARQTTLSFEIGYT